MKIPWDLVSNGMLCAAVIIDYGGHSAATMIGLAILTRLWYQEKLKEEEKNTPKTSRTKSSKT